MICKEDVYTSSHCSYWRNRPWFKCPHINIWYHLIYSRILYVVSAVTQGIWTFNTSCVSTNSVQGSQIHLSGQIHQLFPLSRWKRSVRLIREIKKTIYKQHLKILLNTYAHPLSKPVSSKIQSIYFSVYAKILGITI